MLPCYRAVNFFLPRICLSRTTIGALSARALPDLSCAFKEHCSPLQVTSRWKLNCFVQTFHDDLTPRFGLRHDPSRCQGFGGTLARMTQLAQSIRFHDERFARSLVLVKQVMKPFEFMDRGCCQDADFNIARQSVDNLPLHILHVWFICDLFNTQRFVV